MKKNEITKMIFLLETSKNYLSKNKELIKEKIENKINELEAFEKKLDSLEEKIKLSNVTENSVKNQVNFVLDLISDYENSLDKEIEDLLSDYNSIEFNQQMIINEIASYTYKLQEN